MFADDCHKTKRNRHFDRRNSEVGLHRRVRQPIVRQLRGQRWQVSYRSESSNRCHDYGCLVEVSSGSLRRWSRCPNPSLPVRRVADVDFRPVVVGTQLTGPRSSGVESSALKTIDVPPLSIKWDFQQATLSVLSVLYVVQEEQQQWVFKFSVQFVSLPTIVMSAFKSIEFRSVIVNMFDFVCSSFLVREVRVPCTQILVVFLDVNSEMYKSAQGLSIVCSFVRLIFFVQS